MIYLCDSVFDDGNHDDNFSRNIAYHRELRHNLSKLLPYHPVHIVGGGTWDRVQSQYQPVGVCGVTDEPVSTYVETTIALAETRAHQEASKALKRTDEDDANDDSVRYSPVNDDDADQVYLPDDINPESLREDLHCD